ncbi:MAG: AAA family ATPase [Gammaproteobacteria bacterium]|nr:AAA family ATPase [Gammaproteobacteria bacterium]
MSAATDTPQQAARRLAAGAISDGFEPQALHKYTDAAGDVLFFRIRLKHPGTDKKWIRPMHLNGAGYVLSEPAFPNGKPLYRLQDLAARPGAPVFVTEGENCADALAKLGMLATTSGGSTSAEAADWTPLAGREVTIWPDNDKSGEHYALAVTAALEPLGCVVRVLDVEPLDLPPEGDAVDWLAANPDASAADVLALPVVAEQARPLPTVSRCLADLTPERVRWLWPGRIAKGKVTMLAGHPGLGKSQITASLAAIVTTGGQWPVDRHRAERGAVVILSAEDDAADTILPRMLAAGADTRRIHVLDAVRVVAANGETCERTFDLTRDIGALAALLDSIEGAALVVIDPVTAYMGGVDSHRNAEVRGMLAPLSDMAARYGVAVLGVSHLNKSGGGDALMRVTGSLAFVAAARAAWLVAKDPGDAARRLFLPMKNNIGPDAAGLAFRIESATVADGIETSLVVWDGEPVTMAASEALDAEGRRDDDVDAPQRGEAEAWLRDALDAGPVASEDLKRMARDDGMSWRTVERAKKSLGVVARKHGFDTAARWAWYLPDSEDRHRRPPAQFEVAVFDESKATSHYGARVSPKTVTATGLGGLRGLEMGGAGCTTVEGEL